MQPAAPLQAPFLGDLAAAMCKARGPPQALLTAAAAVHQQLPSLVFVGLAVLAQDKHSVKYNVLHSTRQGAARLGAVAASNCAACLAIDTKQVVHVRELRHGDLGFHDLRYLQQEHEARTCYVVPLVVAQNAVGALSMAATQADAFSGHEPWLQVVAAMCAPYLLLLRSHEGLLALESLVSQVLPMRVALQLQDQHRRAASMLDMPHGAAQQQLLPAADAAIDPSGAGQQGQSSVASVSASGRAGPRHTAAGTAARMDVSQPGSSLRHLRARQRSRQQQPHQQPHQPEQQQALLAARTPLLAAGQPQQQPGQSLAAQSWQILPSLPFQPPRLEQAYQHWALQQWLRLLDAVFLLLVLLSAFGGTLQQCLAGVQGLLYQPAVPLSDRQLTGCIGSCVLVLLIAGLLLTMHQLPAHLYLQWRGPAVAALRVLRTMLLVADLWRLPVSSTRLSTHSVSTALAGSSQASSPVISSGPPAAIAQAAVCSLLLLLGLMGQLPGALHAVVQAGCLGLVAMALVGMHVPHLAAVRAANGVAGVMRLSANSFGNAGWSNPALLLVTGWVLPVALGVAIEWSTRRYFLRKIR